MDKNKKITLTPDIYFREIPKIIDMDIRSELYYLNEFTFAVAVILSAQATDKQVNKVVSVLFQTVNTPKQMLELGLDGLIEHIRVITFFNNKAKNIIKFSQQLIDLGGKLPRAQSELMKLSGVGQKTANVIMNVLWGMPFIGIDTHLYRLSHRFGWATGSDNTPEKVEKKLLEYLPEKYHVVANNVMVLHGRYTCRAVKPVCDKCPVYKWCNAPDKREIK